jgi:adenylate cyclase
MERRLSAILAADVVGYTRLMEADEEGTLVRLKAALSDIVDPKIAESGGRIVKTTGDGMLVEFTSAVEAVRGAVEVQEEMAARGGDIRFRIGVNIGDIMIDSDDIFGDGVNLAARLEAAAPEGGILISAAVHDHIAGKVEVMFGDGSAQNFKNISKPVHVWRWQPEGAATAEGTEQTPLALPDKPSIAVLPFNNMSGDPEQEYFSDGITEDIITALSKFRWFFVTARNSTFAYKGQSPNILQVARELGVQYVLEGSVRKAGQRVRITGQLIDALSGNHIWAERYDRELVDIFDLQDEITSAITGAVAPELAETLRKRSVQKAPESLDAWDLHNRAMWHLYRFNKADAAAAMALFERAIQADEGFAAAHASLGYQHFLNVILGFTENSAESLDAGYNAAKRAVKLDDRDSLGHCMMGRILAMYGQHDASIAALDRALDLNPNSAMVRLSMGLALAWAGRNAEAISHLDEALRLNPNDPSGWSCENIKAACLVGLERYEEALAAAQRAIQYPNADFWPHAQKAFVLSRMGRIAEAKAALATARDMRSGLSVALFERMLSGYYEEGKIEYLNDLRKIGLSEK